MAEPHAPESRFPLQEIARHVMIARGLEPEFPPAVHAELGAMTGPASGDAAGVRDLRQLLWCSIDNEESRDLDQLSVAEPLPDGTTRLLVAIADVAELVRSGSAIDEHARRNTTTVYTVAEIFPMLPEKLSTDLTSLNPDADRRALVADMVVAASGEVTTSNLYPAWVRNCAKLSYDGVAAWLAGSDAPARLTAVPGLAENLRLQLSAASKLKALRHTRGALSFETVQTRAVFTGGELKDLEDERQNPAKSLIEDLMIAANGATARFLEAKGFASIRRVVRTPKRWDRIVELAAERHVTLPLAPDSVALENFLTAQRSAHPTEFADLSLSVIKLLGAGEYAVDLPGDALSTGHFGLAVKDYAHSTAPNRRYPDLLTQRLLKAAMAGLPSPYSTDELTAVAEHCTRQEDAAKKVERQVLKSAAALLLRGRIGEIFDALVTGASTKGTWVRIPHPSVEGKLLQGFYGRQVGQRMRVKLVGTNVERGLIDFVAA